MKDIEWNLLLFGDEPSSFLLEILIRATVMFCFILIALRASGKRGIKQLSIFELIIIIGLGSAAGDPMLYKDVGILPALAVFITIVSLYRFITYLSGKYQSFEHLLEGKPLYLIRNGKFSISDFNKEDLSQDEFFTELRKNQVEHLGQVKSAVMETTGEVSLLFYADNEIKHGLPLYPDLYLQKKTQIEQEGIHACAYCGHTECLSAPKSCNICNRNEWVLAMNTIRIS